MSSRERTARYRKRKRELLNEPERPRGRPKLENPTTSAERMRQCRERKQQQEECEICMRRNDYEICNRCSKLACSIPTSRFSKLTLPDIPEHMPDLEMREENLVAWKTIFRIVEENILEILPKQEQKTCLPARGQGNPSVVSQWCIELKKHELYKEVKFAKEHIHQYFEKYPQYIMLDWNRSPPSSWLFRNHLLEYAFPSIYFGESSPFCENMTRKHIYSVLAVLLRQENRKVVSPAHLFALLLKLSSVRELPVTIPYWNACQKDLGAMIRQLGPPTLFLTLNASYLQWSDRPKDAVALVLRFQKLSDAIVRRLQSDFENPFGMKVVDFYTRIKFQYKGSSKSQTLLWLKTDEPPERIADALITTSLTDQEQNHICNTFCKPKNNSECKYGYPMWPMIRTHVLTPVVPDEQTETMRKAMKYDWDTYETIEDFWKAHDIHSEEDYLHIVCSDLKRPTVLPKRSMEHRWTSPHNSWIASRFRANTNLQVITSLRGLVRHVTNPPSYKLIGSEEAAWLLLRLPLVSSNRRIIYLPTTRPEHRRKNKRLFRNYENRTGMKNTCLADYVSESGKHVLRFRHYEPYETDHFKREMVTLFWPFANEDTDISDTYGDLYDLHQKSIWENAARYGLRPLPVEEPDPLPAATESVLPSMSEEDYLSTMRLTNFEQREFLLEAIYRSRTLPLQVFLTGPAGSGKTMVLQLLKETWRRRNIEFLCCATTGKAATLIGGSTTHSVFRLTSGAKPKWSSTIGAAMIDEASMLSVDMLCKIESQIQRVRFHHSLLFGGMHMVLCGDLRQLPPVRGKSLSYKNSLWCKMERHELKQSLRQQTDAGFLDVLTALGDKKCLTKDQIRAVESRFVKDPPSDATRLFRSRAEVQAYIDRVYVDYDTCEAEITPYSGAKYYSRTIQMPRTLKLCLEKPYMLLVNTDIEDGLINGAVGILKRVDNNLWFDFGPDTGRNIRQSTNQPWVAVKKVTVIEGKERVRQFPVIEAEALTVHKAQGTTYRKVAYEYHPNHPLSLVYVAMSRVSTFDDLFLTNAEGNYTFCHPSVAVEEGSKPQRPLVTQVRKCLEFIDATRFSACVLKCSTSRYLLEDITTDPVLPKCDALIFTKTCLPEFQIPEFERIQPTHDIVLYTKLSAQYFDDILIRINNGEFGSTDKFTHIPYASYFCDEATIVVLKSYRT